MASVLDNAEPFIPHSPTRVAGAQDQNKLDGVEVGSIRSWLMAMRDRTAGSISVLEKIPSQYHGGIKAGTSSVDVRGWIQDAIDESFVAGHRRVRVPGGVYRIEGSLNGASPTPPIRGVNLVGDGRYESVFDVHANTDTDGVQFHHTEAYGFGGGVREILVRGGGEDPTKMRDGISFSWWTCARLSEAEFQYAGRNGIRFVNSMDLFGDRVYVQRAAQDGLYSAGSESHFNTTLHFVHLYAMNSGGCGANVEGTSMTFDGCVFERSGQNADPLTGHGLRLRGGHMNVSGHAHFEANLGHDIYVEGGLIGTTFAIDHCLYDNSAGLKAPGYNGVRIQACNGGTLVAGNVTGFSGDNLVWAIDGGTAAKNVRVLLGTNQTGGVGGTPISYAIPLPQMAGIFEYYDAATTAIVQTGQFRIEPGLGLVLTSPDGTRYLVGVANGGALTTSAL